ncbi:MAG: lipoate-protein ligase [Nocardia sp.]|uniref:lipoyl(octanoyl) transferase LipB n=1 Tax=Nocardia sp. TaxID=1821 RepID=UPI0026020D8A|nr:lipoyl(octanoyl) transferase LipB [Nocardia sp.]MCU1645460.1 lipoate-protein ligase [Nocardia sp.]
MRLVQRIDLGTVPYRQALSDMTEWVLQRRAGTVGDRLFLLEHPPVVTYGRRTEPADLPVSDLELVEVDRGGFATYHGPGQLIGYLIVGLADRGPVDIVRWLENGLIEALATLGFSAIRRETPAGSTSLVGVWTSDHRKLASIGMRIRGGITSHGFALNIDPDMRPFQQFTVCGIHDVTMVSLAELASERGIPVPGDAGIRGAIANALGC